MSTSSALRLPFVVSERPGEDTGVLGGMPSDAPLATAPTSEKEGIRAAEVFAPDDDAEAIGVGEGLALALRELLRGFLSSTREVPSCCIRTTLDKDMTGSYKLGAVGS